jgi:hypothetical protein
MSVEDEVVTVVDDAKKLPADAVSVYQKVKLYVTGLVKRLRSLLHI